MTKPIIFISHISEEAELALLLKEHIERSFLSLVDVFVSSDLESIAAGSQWLESIGEGLQRAQLMLVLASRASIKRPWINFEIGAAWMRQIPQIPVCHTDLAPHELPMPLLALQSVRLSTENGIRRVFQGVAKLLEGAAPTISHADFLSQVAEYERAYGSKLTSMLREEILADQVANAGAEHQAELERLRGTWQGDAADVEIPGILSYRRPLTYRLQLEIALTGKAVEGVLNIDANLPGVKRTGMNLVYVSEQFYAFRYQILEVDSTHFGIMLLRLLPSGKNLEGFFLTKKILESSFGFGRIEFQKTTS